VRSPSGTVFMMVGYQGPDMGEPEAMEERLSMEEEAARLAVEKEARAAKAAQVTDCLRPHLHRLMRIDVLF
jgi:hypothetical protein